jgi:hypothetical protein
MKKSAEKRAKLAAEAKLLQENEDKVYIEIITRTSTRLYWRFYRNIVASVRDHWLQCCDRISNTISKLPGSLLTNR